MLPLAFLIIVHSMTPANRVYAKEMSYSDNNQSIIQMMKQHHGDNWQGECNHMMNNLGKEVNGE